MEMHQVRYFVALCETLNFTRAAERCHVAQPSLTRAIKLLEEELGGPLFHRERNNTHLTELGRLMEPHLKEVLDQAHNARRRASAFFELKTARLKLGVSRGVPLGPLDAVLGRYAADYPETEIHLIDDRAPALREALLRGELEVILLPLRATDLDELHYHPISEERVEVLLAATHPLAARDGIELAALAGETVVTCETCPFWPTIEDRLGQAGLTIRRRIVAGEVDWLRPFVRAGLGVGLRSTGHGLAEGCPLDLHTSVFPTATAAASLYGRIPVWLEAVEAGAGRLVVELQVDRSLAEHLLRHLALSAREYGLVLPD